MPKTNKKKIVPLKTFDKSYAFTRQKFARKVYPAKRRLPARDEKYSNARCLKKQTL